MLSAGKSPKIKRSQHQSIDSDDELVVAFELESHRSFFFVIGFLCSIHWIWQELLDIGCRNGSVRNSLLGLSSADKQVQSDRRGGDDVIDDDDEDDDDDDDDEDDDDEDVDDDDDDEDDDDDGTNEDTRPVRTFVIADVRQALALAGAMKKNENEPIP